MTMVKTITLCGICVGTLANGLTAAAAQVNDTERPGARPEIGAEAARLDDRRQFMQKADYVVETSDLIYVELQETLPGRPINFERLVRPDGKISLTWYGELFVDG